MAWSVFGTLAGPPVNEKRASLVSALAKADQTHSIMQELKALMLSSSVPFITTIPLEIDVEIRNQELDDKFRPLEGFLPSQFLSLIKKLVRWFQQQQTQ
jgi:hypothetical protein